MRKTRAKRPDLDAAIDRQLAGAARVLAENPDFAEGHVSRFAESINRKGGLLEIEQVNIFEVERREAALRGSYVAECKEGNVTIAILPSGRFTITVPAVGWVVSAESLEKIASAFYAATDGPFALHKRGQGKKT